MRIENYNGTLIDALREFGGYEGFSNTRLFLGELGFGTKLNDHDSGIVKGLNTYLQINGYTYLDQVVLSGGLLPEFPPFYSVGNAEKMRMAGKRLDKNLDDEVLEFLATSSVKEGEEKEFLDYKKKWLQHNINNWEDCKEVAKDHLKHLFDGISVGQVDYCQGDEDKFNRKYREEIKVNEFSRQAADRRKKIEAEIKEIKSSENEYSKKIEIQKKSLEKFEPEFETIKKIYVSTSSHKTHAKDPNPVNYVNTLIKEQEDQLFSGFPIRSQKEDLLRRIRGIEKFEDLQKIYEDKRKVVEFYKTKIKELDTEKNRIEKKGKTLEEQINVIDRQLEQGRDITFFTKRAQMKPVDSGWIYKSVKNDYIHDIEDCFPKELSDKLKTHSSNSAKITNLSYGKDDKGNEEILEEADIEQQGDILVIHSTRFNSNSTSLHGLSDLKKEILFRKILKKLSVEYHQPTPKTIITAHGAGGFSATRINLSPDEKYVQSSNQEDSNYYRTKPHFVDVIDLPVFQSTDALAKFYNKGMNKSWGVKRLDKKVHASAAVLQTVLEDGSTIYEVIDTAGLIHINNLRKEILEKKRLEQDTSKMEEELKLMCSSTLKIRAGISDVHLGVANFAGTPTNFQRIERTINYLKENYNNLLDEIILQEVVDGVLKHTGIERKFYGKTVPELREEFANKLEKLAKNPTKNSIYQTLEEVLEEYTSAMSQNSIPNLGKQHQMIDVYIKKIIEGINSLSQVTAVSGNHPRSTEGDDEATRIQEKVKIYDKKGKIKRVISDSEGSPFGGQGVIPGEIVEFNGEKVSTGKRIAYFHAHPGGKNTNINLYRWILDRGVDYDEIYLGHTHSPIVSYANGTFATIFPSCQGPNDYSLKLPVTASPYGTTISFSNVAPEGHPANKIRKHAWQFVNDNTLEREKFIDDRVDNALRSIRTKLGISKEINDDQEKIDIEYNQKVTRIKNENQKFNLSKEEFQEVVKNNEGHLKKIGEELGISLRYVRLKIDEFEIDVESIRKEKQEQKQEKEITEIKNLLEDTSGNISEIARRLGINKSQVSRRIKKYNIE